MNRKRKNGEKNSGISVKIDNKKRKIYLKFMKNMRSSCTFFGKDV
jgi:hypothetical protein